MDSLAQSRSSDMNEASRRLLSVLLRFVDGFKATNSIIVAATNRKQDLDAALLSRCDTIVSFPLPDRACRADILEHYAAHLSLEARRLRLPSRRGGGFLFCVRKLSLAALCVVRVALLKGCSA